MDKQTQKELLNIVEKNYNEIAEHYSETRKKKLWPELEEFTNQVKDGERVLDVGCGSGKLLQGLGDKKIYYLGVDICEELIARAKEAVLSGRDQDFKFNVGNILDLGKIPELDFDYVFCIAVLQHIPSQEWQIQALRQLKNKIKPDGKIILSVWNMWSGAWEKKGFRWLVIKFFLLKLIGKNKMDFGDILFNWKNSAGQIMSQRYYHAFTKRELKKITRAAGLKIEKLYKDQFNYYLILKK